MNRRPIARVDAAAFLEATASVEPPAWEDMMLYEREAAIEVLREAAAEAQRVVRSARGGERSSKNLRASANQREAIRRSEKRRADKAEARRDACHALLAFLAKVGAA